MATQTADQRDDLAIADGDALEVRAYELGFHLDPELPQEEVKKTFEGIRGRIAALATVIAEGEPTKIPLAYTISRMEVGGRRDFTSAFFAWISYEATATAHEEIGAMAREEKRIFRFIDIRTTRDAAQHASEMHELFIRAAANEGQEPDEAAEPIEAAPAEEEPKEVA